MVRRPTQSADRRAPWFTVESVESWKTTKTTGQKGVVCAGRRVRPGRIVTEGGLQIQQQCYEESHGRQLAEQPLPCEFPQKIARIASTHGGCRSVPAGVVVPLLVVMVCFF